MKKSLILLAVTLTAALSAAAAQAVGVDISGLFTPEVAMGLGALGAAGTTTFVQGGDVIDWTNGGTAVSSGDVVKIGQILGVALVDIANGATGSVAIRGVYTVPKVSAAVIAQGEALTWDVSAGAFDDNLATPASGDVTGAPAVAFEAAGATVTSMDVMFTGVPGTVTA